MLTPGLSPEDFDPFTAMDRGEQPAAVPPEQSAANWRSLGLAFGNPRD